MGNTAKDKMEINVHTKHQTNALILDGDDLREVLAVPSSHFDRASRLSLAYTYARFCKLLADQGAVVIIATISLFHDHIPFS